MEGNKPDTGLKQFPCAHCPKLFLLTKSLEQHILSRHGKDKLKHKPFQCSVCFKTKQVTKYFAKKGLLTDHIRRSHGKRCIECNICFKTFAYPTELRAHRRVHSDTKFKCDLCSKVFTVNRSLQCHLFYVHHQKFEGVRYYKCDFCPSEFMQIGHLEDHVLDQHVIDKEFECDICSKTYVDQKTLEKHVKEHDRPTKSASKASESKVKETPVIKKQFFKCQLCPKTFDREVYFSDHRKIVHPNAKWTCDLEQCTKSFKRYDKFRDHKITHSELRAYICPTCQKSFKLQKHLKRHEQIHQDEKKFKCEMCPKSFVRHSARVLHIANKHGGPKPFKCPVPNCGMTFPTSSYLKTHSISHETTKLFKCEICTETKEFKSHVSLRQHLRYVHQGDKEKSRRFNQVVFTCTSKDCPSFKTGSEKEVAMHYNEQHGLPKVQLFQSIIKIENIPLGSVLSFSEEIPNCETSRLILKRYKCKFCLKLFNFSEFKKHPERCLAKSVFKCSRCSKTFRYKNSLNKHVRDQHDKQKQKLILQK